MKNIQTVKIGASVVINNGTIDYTTLDSIAYDVSKMMREGLYCPPCCFRFNKNRDA